ncbi:hypothetical protein D3C87_1906420 [compost metagenome]
MAQMASVRSKAAESSRRVLPSMPMVKAKPAKAMPERMEVATRPGFQPRLPPITSAAMPA